MLEISKKNKEEKKTYTKPLVTKVELTPAEAFLGACKTTIVSGPAAATCDGGSCSEIAS